MSIYSPPPNPPSLHKDDRASIEPFHETSVLNFNRQLILITFVNESQFVVRDYETGNEIATRTWTGGGWAGTAIVRNGVIHIFGNKDVGGDHSIVHSTLDGSYDPSSPTTVYTILATNIANLGITAGPDGYVMSLEMPSAQTIRFIKSEDLETWEVIGNDYTPGGYIGSPKIYYTNGAYYVSYLASPDYGVVFFTAIARSNDSLDSLSLSENPLLYPEFWKDDRNASDLTLAEDNNGNVVGVWCDGNQLGVAHLRKAIYDRMSLQSLFESLFP